MRYLALAPYGPNAPVWGRDAIERYQMRYKITG